MQLVHATTLLLAMRRSAPNGKFALGDLAPLAGLSVRQVSNAIDSLRARGLVESQQRGVWRLTDAGRAVDERVGVQIGRAVPPPSATTGVSAAQRAQGATGLRAAAWRALRIRRSATADELCSLVDDGSHGANVRDRVLAYFGKLKRCQVIASKKVRPGTSEQLYILLRDLGMAAPTVSSRGRVYDPNKGEFLTVTDKEGAQ